MIKRQSLKKIELLLSQNKDWKILDIGCADRPNKYANYFADIIDLSNHFSNNNFTLLKQNKRLPFDDNQFDFVICSHVLEHVENPVIFAKELSRVANKGYIELPSRLEDNIVFINQKAHRWWFIFNDDSNTLIYSEKKNSLKPFMSTNLAWKFRESFRESMVIEIYWENSIEIKRDENLNIVFKISRFNILKKYISFILRSLIKK